MDKTTNEKINKYIESIKTIIDPKMIILYGSYAKGTENELSDIDIAFVVDKDSGNILDDEFRMYKMRRDIDDRIEPVVLNINNDKSGFLDSILRYGKILYNS